MRVQHLFSQLTVTSTSTAALRDILQAVPVGPTIRTWHFCNPAFFYVRKKGKERGAIGVV